MNADEMDDSLRIGQQFRTLRELALERMRDAILSLQFQPGERLVERPLSERLGVSRTVVREVLRHLEAEGLVEIISQKGPIVAHPSLETAREIYEIRGQLEGMAAAACATQANSETIAALGEALNEIQRAFHSGEVRELLHATSRFYELMFYGGGKRVGWQVVQSLNAKINHLRALTLSSPGRENEGMPKMREIFEAISTRNPERARAACQRHVEKAAEIAGQLIREQLTPGSR